MRDVAMYKRQAAQLQAFADRVGRRLARRVRPNLCAQAAALKNGELRVSFHRQTIADPDAVTCLGCDTAASEHLRMRVASHSPFGVLPRDPHVFLLFCGARACEAKLDQLADALAMIEDPLAQSELN